MMDCVSPPALSEDQLSAVLDGEAAPAVLEHLAACSACSGRLLAARQLEGVLRGRLQRWDCPSAEELGEFQLDLLGRTEQRAVAAHLAECVRCRDELAELQVFLGAPVVTPTPRSGGSWLKVIIAQLLPPDTTTVTRGPRRNTSESYLLPESGTVINLQWQSRPDATLSLAGQVAASNYEDWIGALVELRRGEALVARASLDELGAFRFERLAADEFELRIIPPAGGIVLVPKVQLAG